MLAPTASESMQASLFGCPELSRWRRASFGFGRSYLVAGDPNELSDIFGRDQKGWRDMARFDQNIRRADPPESLYLGSSGSPAISADGHHVAFLSSASNLVPDDMNNDYDVFVRDETRRAT